MLNWIYVSLPTRELRYGNRTASIAHTVGPWAWDTGEDASEVDDARTAGDNGGGLTLEGREGCIAVEVEGGWKLFWEDAEGKVPDVDGETRRKLQVSIERLFVEDAQDAGAGVKAKENDEKGKGTEKKKESKVQGGVGETGQKKEDRKTEATLEGRTKTVEESRGKKLKKRGGEDQV